MIDKSLELSVTRQAELLGLSRSNVYYLPQVVSKPDLTLVRRMKELHPQYPFAGARMLRDMLALEGMAASRQHVGTLMAKMGVEALYRKRNTSKPHPKNRSYPYLLRERAIDRPNQV